MADYFIDLKDLAQDPVSVEGQFAPGDIDFTGEPVRQTGPLQWSAKIERAGEDIRVAGTLEVPVELSCSRCLEPVIQEIEKPFDLFFRQIDDSVFDEDDEIELSDEDTRTSFFSGTQLAVGDILREQVLLALPMKALCKVDCQGLCPSCGTNLNQGACACPKEQFSPHMDQLLEIKRKLEERS